MNDTARLLAQAAMQVEGVAELHRGEFGEVATYLPGEQIAGVRLGESVGEIHLVTDLRRNVWTVAEEVRAAAEQIAGMPIIVTVEDVVTEDVVTEEQSDE